MPAKTFLRIIRGRIESCNSSVEHAIMQYKESKEKKDAREMAYWYAIIATQRIISEDLLFQLELNSDFVNRTDKEAK